MKVRGTRGASEADALLVRADPLPVAFFVPFAIVVFPGLMWA
jgi:hypothetical protein